MSYKVKRSWPPRTPSPEFPKRRRLSRELPRKEPDSHDPTIIDARLCSKCRCINLEDMLLPWPNSFSHHDNEQELVAAARSGCSICGPVCRGLSIDPWPEYREDRSGIMAPKARRIGDHLHSSKKVSPPSKFPLTLRLSCVGDAMDVYSATTEHVVEFWVCTDEGDNASAEIRRRRVPNVSTLEGTLQQLGSIILSSESSSRDVPYLPRRVLDVKEQGHNAIYLRDSSEHPPRARYICLSHRWAQSVPLTTTVETLECRKQSIPLGSLSQTLRDAVSLCRAFGIKYLWIDSLCILQNSTSDWEIESAKMGVYYQNSWLTLAAGLDHFDDPDESSSSSKNFDDPQSSSSIFGPRYVSHGSAMMDGYDRVRIRMRKSDYEPNATIYLKIQDENHNDNRAASQLTTRGWTLQEEAMSPCLLSFLPCRTIFRAAENVYYESGDSKPTSFTSFLSARNYLDPRGWGDLVEDYSKRYLTNTQDKLPALSGLAHQYRQQTGDTYLAGIWLHSLDDHLCWCVPHSSTGPKVMRSKSYRAPSWSWACLDGGVTFDKSPIEGKLQIKDFSIKLKGHDPLGQVESASISVEAKLNGQRWKRRSDGKWYYACPSTEFRGPSSYHSELRPFTSATLVLDAPISDTDELEIWSFPLKGQFALALQSVDGDKMTFTRIGVIVWRCARDDGPSCEEQIITII